MEESSHIESTDPKRTDLPAARCTECDREMDHYNSFLGPDNRMRIICWECISRQEKGFNAKRDFHRGARSGDIPR